MADRVTWLNTALLVLSLGGVGALHLRVSALEQGAALPGAALRAPAARMAGTQGMGAAADRAHLMGAPPPMPRSPAALAEAPAAPEGVGTQVAIEEHLWSEEGRAAIDDVVAQREQQEREQMRARFQQMMQFRTDRAVEAVADRLDLPAKETEALRALVTGYMEARGERWRQMHDGDVDVPKLQEEAEAAREAFERDVVERVGEEGLEALREGLDRGRGL